MNIGDGPQRGVSLESHSRQLSHTLDGADNHCPGRRQTILQMFFGQLRNRGGYGFLLAWIHVVDLADGNAPSMNPAVGKERRLLTRFESLWSLCSNCNQVARKIAEDGIGAKRMVHPHDNQVPAGGQIRN